MTREEIYPLLNPKDSILPMRLGAIFPNVTIFTSVEFAEQERKLGKIIRIYHLNEDGRIRCPENRVYGSFFHNDRPMLHLLINSKDLIFTEHAKYRQRVFKHFRRFKLWYRYMVDSKRFYLYITEHILRF